MIQTLSDKLLTLLGQFQWSGQPFVQVLDYHTLDAKGYPYLTFENTWFVSEINDSCNNDVKYLFQILIFQDIVGDGRKKAKEIMSKAIVTIKDILAENYTLDWTVTRVVPTNATISPVVLNSWTGFVGEIIVEIDVIEFIR